VQSCRTAKQVLYTQSQGEPVIQGVETPTREQDKC